MMNYSKVKILSNSPQKELILDDHNIEIVDELTFLGQLVFLENQTEKEVNRHISLVWKKCSSEINRKRSF